MIFICKKTMWEGGDGLVLFRDGREKKHLLAKKVAAYGS